MGKLLATVLTLFLSSALRKILIGAGISIVSATFYNTLIEYLLNKVLQNLNSGSASILNLLMLSGLDTSLSIIFGALTARAVIVSSSLFLSKS